MKTLTGVIVGVAIVLIIIFGVLQYQKNEQTNTHGGSLYIGVTDASADISNVSDIDMSIKKVEVHSATDGWVTASGDAKTYALLSLKASGKTELYGKNTVTAGSYDRVRVTLGDTTVHTKTKGNVKAVAPASQVIVNATVVVKENENSTITLDFLADKSLHTTSDGQYVFAPVVKTQSRSGAQVTVDGSNAVLVSGGTVNSDTIVGVDLDGSSKADFQLNTGTSLKIDSSLGNTIKFMLGGKTYTSDSTKVQDTQSSTLNVDMNSGVQTQGSSSSNTSTSTDGSMTLPIQLKN